MIVSIKNIDFSLIKDIWSKFLWPNRQSSIDPTSAVIYPTWPFEYNTEFLLSTPSFFGIYENNQLAGVNSGHKTGKIMYRSRGLYVFPEFRGKKYGKILLEHTCEQAEKESSIFCWSIPRIDVRSVYESAKFSITSAPFVTETLNTNVYAIRHLI